MQVHDYLRLIILIIIFIIIIKIIISMIIIIIIIITHTNFYLFKNGNYCTSRLLLPYISVINLDAERLKAKLTAESIQATQCHL